MSTAAIIQPNYLPWKGYFDILHRVDVMVIFDDVQYTTRDWRNRNRIKLSDGRTGWITVPVVADRGQLIKDARIDVEQNWAQSHLGRIRDAYAAAPYFERYFDELGSVLTAGHTWLVDLDIELTEHVSNWLGITTQMMRSSSMKIEGTRDDRLISILTAIGADRYISGPAARAYITPEKFADAGIDLVFYDYPEYPEYRQLSEPFIHEVSIIDLLFCTGPSAPEFIWASDGSRPGLESN